MTATLAAAGLTFGYGPRALFHDVSLKVAPGDVVGLVGPNGCGKSTLLRVLAGDLAAEAGTLTLSPAAATVGYLPQEASGRGATGHGDGEPASWTVLQEIRLRTGVGPAAAELQEASRQLADRPAQDVVADRYSQALERFLALGTGDLDERAAALATRWGIDLAQSLDSLSGGQAARVGLAALVLSRFDVLLLDEPTNNLDLAGLRELEHFVTATRGGIVVVSHDRDFLTRTVNRVVEFDPMLDRVVEYGGGYRSYRTERARAQSAAQADYDRFEETQVELAERMRRARASAERGERSAQRAYQHGRVDKLTRDMMVDGATSGASLARRVQRVMERLEPVEQPRRVWQLRMSVPAGPPSGSVVAVLDAATVRYGDFTLGPVTLQVNRGERIGVSGPNGAGKSTLLRLVLGELTPSSGTAHLGSATRVGRVDQARDAFAGQDPLLERFRHDAPRLSPAQARTLLAKFGLAGDDALRPCDSLSPGERTRAGLAVLSAAEVNLLILDEPTNHLDVPAIEALEGAICGFAGTLIVVSHDRALLRGLRLDRWLAVTGGSVQEVPADPFGGDGEGSTWSP